MNIPENKESQNEDLGLLTTEQACEYLNLTLSMLRSLVFKKQIPVIRIGKCLRFSKSDLIKWLQEKGLTA